MQAEQAQADQQAMIQEQQMIQEQARQQAAQRDYEAAENIERPQQGPPQGEMPEDPLMAERAQQRLQGGPDAENIRRQEFEQNAPS